MSTERVDVVFKRQNVIAKIDDVLYELVKPSLEVFRDFREKSEANKEDEILEVVKFVNQAGLPIEICWKLEPEWLFQLVELLTGKKK